MNFLFPFDEPDATWFREFMDEVAEPYEWNVTDDKCLEWLKARTYPDGTECPGCGKPSKFHRIRGRRCYGCQYCGHQAYPTAGTIFHKTTIPLSDWFSVVLLMEVDTEAAQSSAAISKHIGVTQKTAYYMRKRIYRAWMENDLTATRDEASKDSTHDASGEAQRSPLNQNLPPESEANNGTD